MAFFKNVFLLFHYNKNKKKFMPQFDFFSFFVQIFWFLSFACFLYLIHVKLLAKVATSMKLRSKLNALTSSKTVKAKSIYNIILKMFNK